MKVKNVLNVISREDDYPLGGSSKQRLTVTESLYSRSCVVLTLDTGKGSFTVEVKASELRAAVENSTNTGEA